METLRLARNPRHAATALAKPPYLWAKLPLKINLTKLDKPLSRSGTVSMSRETPEADT